MECVIQAFPDEYHLQTLEQLLDTTSSLNKQVDIKNIFVSLMEKLSKFAQQSNLNNQGSASLISSIDKDLNIFGLFKKYTDKIIEDCQESESIDISKLLELEVAFMNFSIKTYPHSTENVNLILESCTLILQAKPISQSDNNSMKLLVKLLTIPLDVL